MNSLHSSARKCAISACAASLLVATPVAAQQQDDSYFRITPYFWMLGLDGTTAALGQNTDVDASFSDILDVLNIALSVNMEWNNGAWFLVLDPLYAQLEADYASGGPLPINGTVEIDMLLVDGMIGLELTDSIDVYAGARYYDQDISIFPANLPTSASLGESWTDLVLGVRGRAPISDNWSFAGKLDAAVAGDSDSAIYAQAVFMRHFGETRHLDIGYRYYAVDYETGSGVTRFLWDVDHSGPLIGYSWTF